MSHVQPILPRPTGILTAIATLLLAVPLAACGSSTSASSAQVRRQTCKRVEAVLSDGPEPEADPVGHAQAQILPLRGIHTTDAKLAGAIDGLASAYQRFSQSNGARSARVAVSAASKTIETLCPGVEP